jgi:hypothetical protein
MFFFPGSFDMFAKVDTAFFRPSVDGAGDVKTRFMNWPRPENEPMTRLLLKQCHS